MSLGRALDLLAGRDTGSLQRELQGVHGRWRTRVRGTLRHRRTLGVLLGAVARRALKGRQPRLIAGLELGAYRLVFEGEAWESVRSDLPALAEGKKARAHLELVLGNLAAVLGERLEVASEGSDVELPLTRATALRLAKPLLGVEGRGLAARLGVLHSLPDALVSAWIAGHGEEVAVELCRAANDPAPLFARANRLKGEREALRAELLEAGVESELPADAPHALRLTQGTFRNTPPWEAGAFTIQDLTAQRVAPLLAPRPGERVLDLCAAPGGKTTHLAELSDDQADVLATDSKERRLRRVDENAERLGLRSIRTQRCDGRAASSELAGEAAFDAILVDAPCSNTGVLRRRPEARWRYDARSQQRLAREQEQLLIQAAGLLAPAGRLVYSLCSIEVDEGRERAQALVEARPELRLEREELWFPTPLGGDGGYAALFRRA